jgi:hypothetical protein
MISEEINTTTKKPTILFQDKREDALRVSQEFTTPHPWQSSWCKSFSSFERLCFEKRALGTLYVQGLVGKCFPGFNH